MSLILEALNRSQQDRSAGEAAPGLETAHYTPADPETNALRVILPWAGLLLALLVIAWLLFGQTASQDDGPVPKAEAVIETSPTKSATKALEPTPETVTTKPTPVPTLETKPRQASRADSAVAALYSSEPGAAKAGPVREEVEPAPAVVDKAPAEASAPAPAPEPVAQPTVEEAIDIEAVLARTEQELENSRLAEHPAPFLSGLSQQAKNDIPSLMYSRHDYSATGQSSVVVNGNTVRAGGNVASGVKLEEILPDSIVLNHRGTQFRLRALNSWVNL